MNLSDEVDLEDYVARPDRISGADINSICQEVCNISISIVYMYIILFDKGWYASCTGKSLYCIGKRF
jgi:26S proteasome regulatory subunit T3